MVLMPSIPPLHPNQPLHGLLPRLRPPPQQLLQRRIHKRSIALTHPLRKHQARLKPRPTLPAFVMFRARLDPFLWLEILDRNVRPTPSVDGFDEVDERFRFGSCEEEDVFLRLRFDRRIGGEAVSEDFGDGFA